MKNLCTFLIFLMDAPRSGSRNAEIKFREILRMRIEKITFVGKVHEKFLHKFKI